MLAFSSIQKPFLLSALYRLATTVHDHNSRLRKQYIREVSVSQLNFKKDTTLFQLLCKKYRFEDPHITPLIRKVAYVFDVLIVAVNLNGSIIAVENEKAVQKKWEQLKKTLQKDHSGSAFEHYLHSLDLTIYDAEKLITFLESGNMYGLLFKGLWLYDHIEDMQQYHILETGNTIKLTEKTGSTSQSSQYIFRDNVLAECLKTDNHLQHEVLCLSLKKY